MVKILPHHVVYSFFFNELSFPPISDFIAFLVAICNSGIFVLNSLLFNFLFWFGGATL